MVQNAVILYFAAVAFASVRVGVDCDELKNALNNRFNYFDIDLLRYAAEDKRGNVMISPASVKSTLSMLLEGSEGETAEELRRALRLSPDRDEFREQLNVYLSMLQANTTGATLENANGLFVSERLRPRKQFRQLLQHVYYSELTPVNFSDPARSSELVNSWVSNHTHGLIPRLVEPFNIEPTSSMLVLNALYFKSNWKYAFNALLTRSACFYRGNKCRQVNTMYLQTELSYASVDNLRAHAVELPYEGDRYSMVLLVPRDRDGCLSVIRDLPYMSLAQVLELMEPTDVQLSMPRFTVDYSEDLVQVLKQTRINNIFTNQADFSAMFEDHQAPQVNNFLHKTRVEVNEVGTVAAAATGAMVVPLMGGSTVQLKVDRPFLFFIRDKVSGVVLFEGKIEEPEPAPSVDTLGTKPKQEQPLGEL